MCFHPDQLHRADPLLDLLLKRHFQTVLGALSLNVVGDRVVDCHVHPDFVAVPTSEAEAVQLVISLRWPAGWRCTGCQHTAYTLSPSRPREARCRHCKRRRSVTAGTALAQKHDLCRWFAGAMILGAARQGSARRFARAWKCNYKTALHTLHLLRFLASMLHERTEPRVTAKDSRTRFATKCRPDAYDLRRKLTRNHNVPPGRPLFMSLEVLATRQVVITARRLPRSVVETVGMATNAAGEAPIHARHHKNIIHRVHRTVSPRWHHRYMGSLGRRASLIRTGRCPRRALMLAALAAPTTPHAVVPPP